MKTIPFILSAWLIATACSETTGKLVNEYIPQAPDYDDATLWITHEGDNTGEGADIFYAVSTWELDWTTEEGLKAHYADVYNPTHRAHMATEMEGVARYMSEGNNFYAPYYRHATIDAYVSRNDDTIYAKTRLAMSDVKEAFAHFQAHRDTQRPFILVGFSQGAQAVLEITKEMDAQTQEGLVATYLMGYKVTPADTMKYKNLHAAHDSADVGVIVCWNSVKDVKYIQDFIAIPNTMCINPVNWRTDDTPATFKDAYIAQFHQDERAPHYDSITVTLDERHKVLVVKGYEASEYVPYLDMVNVGDLHGAEPWLYSDFIRHNIKLRTQQWYKSHRGTKTE